MIERPAALDTLIDALQTCRLKQDRRHAKQLYAFLREHHLDSHSVLGNYLVPMLVACGCLPDAQLAFDRIPHRNDHSWCSLICGYVDCGEIQQAFILLDRMQQDRVCPSKYTLMPLLRACSSIKDFERGRALHASMVLMGLEADLFLCNSVMDMYAKCALLMEAHNVFDSLTARDAISWNALIAGYAEQGFCKEAHSCLRQMQLEGVSPSTVTFLCSLTASGIIGASDTVLEMHAEIVKRGLETEFYVGTSLVDAYAKCSYVIEAHAVFDKLPVKNAASWVALIAGYAEHREDEKMQMLLEKMQLDGVPIDAVTFIRCLKACSTTGALEAGRRLHIGVRNAGLERDALVGNTLIDMYAKCGSLAEAQEVFDQLPIHDTVSWNVLIAGHSENGCNDEALRCFEQMQVEGVSPADATLVCSLKACASIGDIERGQLLCVEICRKGMDNDLFVGSSVVDLYAKCGSLSEAQHIFDRLPVRNVVTWTTLICGYAEHGFGKEALDCFHQMQLKVSPTDITFSCSLKSCSILEDLQTGLYLHAEITKRALEKDLSVANALVDMYCKCGSLTEGQEVFVKLPVRDVVSWTAMINGSENDQDCSMCVQPNSYMFVAQLKACTRLSDAGDVQEIHNKIIHTGFEGDAFVGNTLVDMYVKCGSLAEAHHVFDRLLVRDAVSWNALIGGYNEHGLGEDALSCFKQMQLENVSPVAVTFACSLKACGIVGTLETGQEICVEIIKRGLDRDVSVGNALVDLYASCSSLDAAQDMFDKLPVRDVVSWNTMIKWYGETHQADGAIKCFAAMQEQGVRPNAITFTCLLAACSHASLILEGQEYFRVMRENYGIEPIADHYACMVDLLARSGHVYEAQTFAEAMQCLLSKDALTALLSACNSHGEVELGLKCFMQLVQASQDDAVAYLLMADVYASAGKWSEASNIEEVRNDAGAKKKLASASIEVNGNRHEFFVGENQNEIVAALWEALSSCIRLEGHVPNLGSVYKQIPAEGKEATLICN